jgi:hypothetical protein
MARWLNEMADKLEPKAAGQAPGANEGPGL